MKNSTLSICLICILVAQTYVVGAQSPSQIILNEIAGEIVKKQTDQPAEVLYVHIDKPFYRAGSIIWFRAYLLDKYTNQISSLSKVAYVDLINEQDSIIEYVILNAGEQGMDGGIKLSSLLPEGNYRLRAYTNHILKNQPEQVFIYNLYIISNSGSSRFSMTGQYKGQSMVRFYPEGGSIISGINNVIAYSAQDAQGNLISTAGIVKDDRDSVVAVFNSSTGLGKFIIFPPSRNRKYTAYVTGNNSAPQAYPLQKLNAMAYQLAVTEQNNEQIKFRVALGDSVYNKKTPSYLLAVAAGTVCFASMGQGMYEINIPKKDLPAGVVTFHLFNEQKQQVSERKVFNERKELIVDIIPNKNNYLPRDLVKMVISIKDIEGKPIAAVLSAAVTDNRYIQWPQNSLPIESFVLQQQYTFKISDNHGIHQLNAATKDLLMLAYDTINAKNISPNSLSAVPADSEGLSINGKILNKNREPVENQVVTLFSNQYSHIVFADTTDVKGAFRFSGLNFYDSTRFILQVSNLKGIKQDLNITVDPPVIPHPAIFSSPVFSSDSSYQLAIEKFKKNGVDSSVTGQTKEWLQEVVVRTSIKKNKGSDRQRNNFSRMVTREQLSKVGLSNTANAVMMVPGVIMMNGSLTIRGGMPVLAVGGDIEPIVIVDGVQAATGGSVVNYLNSIPPELIESIEVLVGPEAAQYATRGANGVIIIKTGQPVFDQKNQKQMLSIYPRGYHVSPQFYTPPYENDQVREAAFQDNRSTIYWNGELLTNNEGKVNLWFYTADQPATYTIYVQGVTSTGNVIYETYSIKRGL